MATPAVSNLTEPLMKPCARLTFILSVLLLAATALAQLEQFLGTWETRKSPTTGKANLTVTIVRAGDTIGGTVTFLNPDGTATQLPIAHTEFRGTAVTKSLVSHTEFKGATLDFQSLDHDAVMYWSLTLTQPRRGFLRGDQGELLIEEKVKKR